MHLEFYGIFSKNYPWKRKERQFKTTLIKNKPYK